MHLRPRHGIADRCTVDLHGVATAKSRLETVERHLIRDGIRAVHLGPRPAQNAPRAANGAPKQRFEGRALTDVGPLVDEDQALAVAFVNRARPVDVHREVEAIERDIAVRPGVDVPRPPALTLALGRERVEVARAPPVAIARDENLPGEMPSFGHRRMSV